MPSQLPISHATNPSATSAHSTTTPQANQPLLEVRNVHKAFGAVQALQGVSFTISPGEIVALVGDNGAGKSTLVKIIAGVHPPTRGEIILDGEPCHFHKPADALAAGIETVYQHLALIEALDVADNVYLGRETLRRGMLGKLFGWLNRGEMRRETGKTLEQLHIKIPSPSSSVRSMSGGQRQAIALGRAVLWGRKLLILDEPTAALGVEETEQVLHMIEDLKAKGMTFLVISHNMQDVYRIADVIIVLRQGKHVATLRKADTDPQDIVAYITGAKTSAHINANTENANTGAPA